MSFRDLFAGKGSNLQSFFVQSPKAREAEFTARLYAEVAALHRASPLGTDEAANEFVFDLAVEAFDRAGVTPSIPLGEALYSATWSLLLADGAIGFPELETLEHLTLEEGVALRAYLERKRRYLADFARLSDIAREKLIRIFEGTIGYLPASAFDTEEPETAEDGAVPLKASLIELCDNPREVVERIVATMYDADIANARLFEPTREQLERNLCIASGIRLEDRHTTRKDLVLPTDSPLASDVDMVGAYLGGTPFAGIFEVEFPFRIPFPARFEHTHIVGGSGHGKTQLLQLLIHHDLQKAREDGRSLVVIDSQGDLLRTISHLPCFAPGTEGSLADKLVIVDPTDIEYPVCLNMFDFDRERLARHTPLERERILNGTIELYEYFFGALLGAELTQKQGVIFKYLARLMLEIPDATVHTFRELMEDGQRFRPYMERLPPSARSFFATRFFDRGFNETKKQVLTRLWGVLSNATFERMFSHPRNKVDLFEATNSGKIVLINTAKDLLQEEGAAIFGRFFIALLAQGAIQRAVLPPHERRPTFVYIDEAADYFDDTIEHLLNQARKFKVGMILAHQNLDQLSPALRASMFASTTIKLAGGVSAKDASAFATEMRCDPDFIRGMRKGQGRTAFACYVRNVTPKAISVSVPLGAVESLPALSASEHSILVEMNREAYCARFDEIPPIPVSEPAVETAPPASTEASKPPQTHARATEAPASAPATQPPVSQPVLADAEQPRSAPSETMEPPPKPQAARPQPVDRKPRAPAEPAPLGRGGRQHKYLQQLFKQAAEERGIRAVIEERILDGAGQVDLALTVGAHRIGCEISVTTSRDQELANIEKCLAAGYDEVVLVGADARHLKTMETFIAKQVESDRVRFHVPDTFLAYLDELAASSTTTTDTIRGYKVNVTRARLSEEETRMRRQTIAQVMARSMRRLAKD